MTDPDVSRSTSVGPWSPLGFPAFRALWVAALAANIGTFTFIVAAGWAMTDLTSSAVLVGLVQTAWAVPGVVVAVPAGAWADVVNRRTVLTVANGGALATAAGLAVITAAGGLTPAVVLVATFVESVALTVGSPAYMAIMPRLVDAERVPPAIGLDAISRNIGQSVGPAIAGLIIAAGGPVVVFALNAVAFIGVLVVVRRLPDEVTAAPTLEVAPAGGLRRAIIAGARIVFGARSLWHLLVRLSLASVCAAAVVSLLPLIARRQLDTTATGFGVLAGSIGVGSVSVLQVVPWLRRRWSPERILVAAGATWTAGVLLTATTDVVAVAAVGLFVAGAGAMATLNILVSRYLVDLPESARGRGAAFGIMAVWTGTSVGSVLWGGLADGAGVAGALSGAAIANLVIVLLAAWRLPVAGSGAAPAIRGTMAG